MMELQSNNKAKEKQFCVSGKIIQTMLVLIGLVILDLTFACKNARYTIDSCSPHCVILQKLIVLHIHTIFFSKPFFAPKL